MGDQDDSMNEDSWLYGDGDGVAPPGTNGEIPRLEMDEPKGSPEPPPPAEEPPGTLPEPVKQDEEPPEDTELPRPPGEEDILPAPGTTEPAPPGEDSPKEEGEEDDDDEDSDDDIHVTIGNIKTAPPQYPNINKMRGAVLSSGVDKISKSGKFSIEEFESIGSINGVQAHEFSIDALEEKPWRKPGADITDYFNYGFNEDTWRAYCERQKTLRIHESGVGLGGLGVPRNPVSISVMNEVKHGGGGLPSMGVPPPMIPSAVVPARKTTPIVMAGGRRSTSVIDVIGGGIASRRTTDSPPKENVIQVMSSERRDFRKSFDMSVPPPGFDAPPPGVAPPPVMPRSALPHHNRSYPPPHGGYGGEYYGDVDYYSGNFEPTQEMQSWGGSEGGSTSKDELPGGITIKQEPIDKGYKETRERDRDRSERHKERSHRHRSRSRSPDRERRSSRKHKSRSRSPGHRSHKKKKSKKSDKRDTGSD
uniref:Pre-mRNA polyadenylation factor Fip1 domain-containing protein n=3 Tax=Lygus hesperus TaxID=30085 RepID=A0A0K8TDI2_LYGHE